MLSLFTYDVTTTAVIDSIAIRAGSKASVEPCSYYPESIIPSGIPIKGLARKLLSKIGS